MTIFETHSLGYVHESSEVSVFFGNALSSQDAVHSAFPDYQLSVLKQTHSDQVVPAPFDGAGPEADAQWTRQPRVALCIRTADCIPVFIHEPISGLIGAAHAGWRGVENEVIMNLGRRMAFEGARFEHARAWIGPHIAAASFEVGRDVGARLEARFEAVRRYSREMNVVSVHEDPEKVRVDLLAIVRAQLESFGIEDESVMELPIDTFTSTEHHSFRRDRERAGRQISFISKKG